MTSKTAKFLQIEGIDEFWNKIENYFTSDHRKQYFHEWKYDFL